MENIGKILRDARLQSGLSIDELHEQTRIVKGHLKQLEQNDFSFLPETYVRSFLKIYADALKLNSSEILHKYERNLKERQRQQQALEHASAEETALEPKRRFIEWSLGFASLVLLVALIFVYMQYRSHIHAEPIADVASKTQNVSTYADISVGELDSDSSFFALQIKAKQQIWLRLTIDGKTVEEHNLAPDEVLHAEAGSHVEVAIGKTETQDIVSSTNEPRDVREDLVRLTFSRDAASEN